jgi:hypothetical protein
MANLCKVTFTVRVHVRPGDKVFVSGSNRVMGDFSPSLAIPLYTTPETYPVWRTAHPVVMTRTPVKYRCGGLALRACARYCGWLVRAFDACGCCGQPMSGSSGVASQSCVHTALLISMW